MTTYAIIQTGGKQYRVSTGDVLRVESLSGEVDSTLELTDVRMVSQDGQVTVGNPTVPDARVRALVRGHGKGKKIIIFRFKSKKRYRRKTGHRQPYTELQIEEILLGGAGEGEAKDGPQKRRRQQPKRTRQPRATTRSEAV